MVSLALTAAQLAGGLNPELWYKEKCVLLVHGTLVLLSENLKTFVCWGKQVGDELWLCLMPSGVIESYQCRTVENCIINTILLEMEGWRASVGIMQPAEAMSCSALGEWWHRYVVLCFTAAHLHSQLTLFLCET